MSDAAAFLIAALVSWWFHAPLWLTVVFAGLATACILVELGSDG